MDSVQCIVEDEGGGGGGGVGAAILTIINHKHLKMQLLMLKLAHTLQYYSDKFTNRKHCLMYHSNSYKLLYPCFSLW